MRGGEPATTKMSCMYLLPLLMPCPRPSPIFLADTCHAGLPLNGEPRRETPSEGENEVRTKSSLIADRGGTRLLCEESANSIAVEHLTRCGSKQQLFLHSFLDPPCVPLLPPRGKCRCCERARDEEKKEEGDFWWFPKAKMVIQVHPLQLFFFSIFSPPIC